MVIVALTATTLQTGTKSPCPMTNWMIVCLVTRLLTGIGRGNVLIATPWTIGQIFILTMLLIPIVKRAMHGRLTTIAGNVPIVISLKTGKKSFMVRD